MKTVIRARDFEVSRAFYSELLGLRVVEEWNEEDDRGAVFALGVGHDGAYVEVSAASSDPRSQRVHALAANDKVELQIHTDSVEAWVERLTGRVDLEGPVTRRWGHRYLWLHDPDGVRIALYETAPD